jgi:transposase
MGKTKVITLTAEQRTELEHGYRQGKTHGFRWRCQVVLLKSEKRTALEITEILGGCEMTINNWLRRYQKDGIRGLDIAAGRGRKSILKDEDLPTVQEKVKQARQRLSLAKAELEQTLEKPFSVTTLKRFLKKTVAATNALEDA